MEIINGGLAVDDRGTIRFANDFDFKGIKRFYIVENHKARFVRAWHGHKKEAKYVLVTSGSALIAVAPLDDLTSVEKVVLSAAKPQLLYIPPGNYNGFMTLTDDATILFFSTATLEESMNDDIRLPADKLRSVWEVEER